MNDAARRRCGDRPYHRVRHAMGAPPPPGASGSTVPVYTSLQHPALGAAARRAISAPLAQHGVMAPRVTAAPCTTPARAIARAGWRCYWLARAFVP